VAVRIKVLVNLYTGSGCQGPQFQQALKRILSKAEAGIVKRSNQLRGFAVLPKAMDGRARSGLA
jgi:hypothetical protein